MNTFIKNKLRDLLNETLLDEDYPSTWDINFFKKLTSFQKRVKYCGEHLKRLSSGSSRIVYQIDETKVLKLARNKRGLIQNSSEYSYSRENMLDSIVARVFDSDDNHLWVEIELAKPVTPVIFKSVTDCSFNVFCNLIANYNNKVNRVKLNAFKLSDEVENALWENEFCYDILQFIGNYSAFAGDLIKLSSYGVVERDGGKVIVLIDYGLNEGDFQKHYM